MRKNLERRLIVYEAAVGHKESEIELEINRMRHRAKLLRNEADGIEEEEEEAGIRERQLELKKRKHARITLQDLQQTEDLSPRCQQGNPQHTHYYKAEMSGNTCT